MVAKRWNIRLSLALLAVLAVIFARRLPPLVATNLTLVVAFTYVIFKAGYAQAELLFYFLIFVLFLIFWRLLDGSNGWRRVLLAGCRRRACRHRASDQGSRHPARGNLPGGIRGSGSPGPPCEPGGRRGSTSSRPAPRRNRQTLHRRRRVRRGFPRGPCALSHQQRTHLRPGLLQRQHHLLCLVRQLGLGEHRHAGAWRWRRVAEAACRSDPISGQYWQTHTLGEIASARRQWVRGHAGAVCTARTGT